MVRSVGRARAAALSGTTSDASSTAAATAARSRRLHGASVRYSRNTASGSAAGGTAGVDESRRHASTMAVGAHRPRASWCEARRRRSQRMDQERLRKSAGKTGDSRDDEKTVCAPARRAARPPRHNVPDCVPRVPWRKPVRPTMGHAPPGTHTHRTRHRAGAAGHPARACAAPPVGRARRHSRRTGRRAHRARAWPGPRRGAQ